MWKKHKATCGFLKIELKYVQLYIHVKSNKTTESQLLDVHSLKKKKYISPLNSEIKGIWMLLMQLVLLIHKIT